MSSARPKNEAKHSRARSSHGYNMILVLSSTPRRCSQQKIFPRVKSRSEQWLTVKHKTSDHLHPIKNILKLGSTQNHVVELFCRCCGFFSVFRPASVS
mmetsp:Transcript_27503/g.56573  ORF Transcript_27503/g.56573 Transcript_27503/m.56573 type:complete len:98 (-) Transcript_27503:322-615(-)